MQRPLAAKAPPTGRRIEPPSPPSPDSLRPQGQGPTTHSPIAHPVPRTNTAEPETRDAHSPSGAEAPGPCACAILASPRTGRPPRGARETGPSCWATGQLVNYRLAPGALGHARSRTRTPRPPRARPPRLSQSKPETGLRLPEPASGGAARQGTVPPPEETSPRHATAGLAALRKPHPDGEKNPGAPHGFRASERRPLHRKAASRLPGRWEPGMARAAVGGENGLQGHPQTFPAGSGAA